MGKSGSGKSTLLNIVMGLLKPMVGEVRVDGVNVEELDKYGPIKGMDGPMWINNMVLYFDFKTSKFYDPKTKKHLTPAQEKDIDPSIIQ